LWDFNIVLILCFPISYTTSGKDIFSIWTYVCIAAFKNDCNEVPRVSVEVSLVIAPKEVMNSDGALVKVEDPAISIWTLLLTKCFSPSDLKRIVFTECFHYFPSRTSLQIVSQTGQRTLPVSDLISPT
jgi:hypothetical protein